MVRSVRLPWSLVPCWSGWSFFGGPFSLAWQYLVDRLVRAGPDWFVLEGSSDPFSARKGPFLTVECPLRPTEVVKDPSGLEYVQLDKTKDRSVDGFVLRRVRVPRWVLFSFVDRALSPRFLGPLFLGTIWAMSVLFCSGLLPVRNVRSSSDSFVGLDSSFDVFHKGDISVVILSKEQAERPDRRLLRLTCTTQDEGMNQYNKYG
ncbi:hypothetical protein PROFUN_15594, partial [Planoprotostelium fungivorum]